MPNKTKTKCERCGRDLVHESESYSCSYNCTFCAGCAGEMSYICPNCSGKLERNERKKTKRKSK